MATHNTGKSTAENSTLEYASSATPRIRVHSPPIVRTIAVWFFLFPLVLVAFYPIACLLPFGWNVGASITIDANGQGMYGPAQFVIVAVGTGKGSWTRMTSGYVNYTGSPPFGISSLDLQKMSYARDYYVPLQPLTREVLAKEFESAGFAPDRAATYAEKIVATISELAKGHLPPAVPGRSLNNRWYSLAGTEAINLGEFGHLLWWPWYTTWLIPVWILLSLFMTHRIWRRYRRMSIQ